ncbi:MAG: hypothetical protein WC279_07480 [Sulfurimonas sp.]|uniref:hypothetical protein n=1 Tax=Sulfurimonas sp. TaxID=2022749 RepID=UPI00356B39B5
MTAENKLFDLTAKLGKIFELNIRNNLVDRFNNKGRYLIIENSLDYNFDGINVDIDIILYDGQRDVYYFIQCKYTINNKPYYKDEIKSFCNNKLFKKGLKQLSSINEAIHQKKFIDDLSKLGVNLNKDKNNFILVLAHTSAQLDFQKIGNVVLYEWNNLRNLLDDGKEVIHHINLHSSNISEHKISSNLKLEDVDAVVDLIMSNSQRDYLSEWNQFIKSDFKIKFNDIEIVSNIR